MTWSAAAGAEFDFHPSVSAQREWNSNVFYVENHADAAAQHGGDPALRDTITRYVAGIDTGFHWGAGERFHIFGEGRRENYDHFNLLDHDEYLAGIGYDWQFGDRSSGKLQYTQEYRMASLIEREDFDKHMEMERKAEADFYIKRTADWRYEIALRARDLHSPLGVTTAEVRGYPTPVALPEEPNFGMREEAVSLGVHYQGTAHIDSGVSTEFLVGKYRYVPSVTDVTTTPPTVGTTNPPSYLQTTVQGFAIYEIKDFSKATGRLGVTFRGDDNTGYTQETDLTGLLSYWRAFTSKTSADVDLQRSVGSYAAGSAGMVNTGAGAHFNWETPFALRLRGGYDWIHSSFQGTDVVDPSLRNRRDTIQTLSAAGQFDFLRYFSLEPSYQRQTRDSNKSGKDYNANIVMVMLRAHY